MKTVRITDRGYLTGHVIETTINANPDLTLPKFFVQLDYWMSCLEKHLRHVQKLMQYVELFLQNADFHFGNRTGN